MDHVEVGGLSQLTEPMVLNFSQSPTQQPCVSWERRSHPCRTGKGVAYLSHHDLWVNRLRKCAIQPDCWFYALCDLRQGTCLFEFPSIKIEGVQRDAL